MDLASRQYVEGLATAVYGILGRRTVGVYLHGSAVLGGYDARRSDLDVLVVCDGPLTSDHQSVLAEVLGEAAMPCPAKGLELSAVTREVARHPDATPPFELHVTTAPDDTKVVDGHDRAGDPDLVLHFAVCRAAGELVGRGLPPEAAFAPVPRALVLAQLDAELAWAAEHVPSEYAVLNACRAWAYAEDRVLLSKVAGGTWVLARIDDPVRSGLVARALARQRSAGGPGLTVAEVGAFVAGVRRRLLGASG